MNEAKMICLLISLASAYNIAPTALASHGNDTQASGAELTEVHGSVYKRGFLDWQRELWADPVAANQGDQLSEGMQLGTGHESWAQLTWPHVTTRAWADSVYAIAPNKRLVYLTSGEMLYHLDKHRVDKHGVDKNPFYVWTSLLQARIRGTTVLVQCTKKISRITVLEGEITVLNRKDHSVVDLQPGAVYEVRERPNGKTSEPETLTGHIPQAFIPLTRSGEQPQEIFSTAETVTSISQIDPHAITAHPLLTNFTAPLSSLPLVNKAMTSVSSLLNNLPAIGDGATRLLAGAVKIVSVPRTIAYTLSPFTAANLPLPLASMDIFPPASGARTNATGQLQTALSGVASRSQLLAGGALNALTGTGALTSMPASFSLPSIGVNTGFTAGLPVTGTTAAALQSTAQAGYVSAIAGRLGGVTSGGLGGITGSAGGVIGGVTGAVGGTTSNITGGVTNLLQNTTSNLLHFP